MAEHGRISVGSIGSLQGRVGHVYTGGSMTTFTDGNMTFCNVGSTVGKQTTAVMNNVSRITLPNGEVIECDLDEVTIVVGSRVVHTQLPISVTLGDNAHVEVSGTNGTFTFDGATARVDLGGAGNSATVNGTVAKMDVTGAGNKVTFTEPTTCKATVSGVSNTVDQKLTKSHMRSH